MKMQSPAKNYDEKTVRGFGQEWQKFDQSEMSDDELVAIFNQYFEIFPFEKLSDNAVGFDFGCGSGRWARLVAPRVGKLHVIDASYQALETCRQLLSTTKNVTFHLTSEMPLPENYCDFGYSLGVLHHIPNTEKALRDCVRALKPAAPFLLYVYYSFENRPHWFRAIWRVSDMLRQFISKMPFPLRYAVSQLFALLVYYPLARVALFAEKLGVNVSSFPLSHYRNRSFYTMRTDALDRFGTRLEKRFSKAQVEAMMTAAGLTNITFSNQLFWVAVGYKQ